MRRAGLRRQIEAFIERDRRESVIRKRFEVCRRRRRCCRDDGAVLTRVSSGPNVFFLDSETREEDLEILSRLLEEPENARLLHEALRKASESLEEEVSEGEGEEEEERESISVLRPAVFWLGDRPHHGFRVRVTSWRKPRNQNGPKARARCSAEARRWTRVSQLRSEAIASGFCA